MNEFSNETVSRKTISIGLFPKIDHFLWFLSDGSLITLKWSLTILKWSIREIDWLYESVPPWDSLIYNKLIETNFVWDHFIAREVHTNGSNSKKNSVFYYLKWMFNELSWTI